MAAVRTPTELDLRMTKPTPTPTPSPTPSPTPTSTPAPAPPPITGEQVLFTGTRGSRHKRVPTGFLFQYSTPMDPATAGNGSSYQADWISTRRVRKKVETVLYPSPVTVQYSPPTTR